MSAEFAALEAEARRLHAEVDALRKRFLAVSAAGADGMGLVRAETLISTAADLLWRATCTLRAQDAPKKDPFAGVDEIPQMPDPMPYGAAGGAS